MENTNQKINEQIYFKSELLKAKIKDYCKIHKLKFIKYHENGFLASSRHNIKAGMKKVLGIDKFEYFDLRTVAKKEVTRSFLCYSDLDIVDSGVISTRTYLISKI